MKKKRSGHTKQFKNGNCNNYAKGQNKKISQTKQHRIKKFTNRPWLSMAVNSWT